MNADTHTTTHIMLIGYGKMGKLIHSLAIKQDIDVCAIVDPLISSPTVSHSPTTHTTTTKESALTSPPMFVTLESALEYITQSKNTFNDIIAIDFAQGNTLRERITQLARHKIGIVIGTTGSDITDDELNAISHDNAIAVLRGSNFSIGVYIHTRLAEYSAQLIRNFSGYDVSLFESHHTEKKDRPSGTALSLARTVLAHYDPHKHKMDFNLPIDMAPRKDTLYISSQRLGTEVGTHSIDYDSSYDRITIEHRAKNREGFARGALLAATFIKNRRGLFSTEQLFESMFKHTENYFSDELSTDGNQSKNQTKDEL